MPFPIELDQCIRWDKSVKKDSKDSSNLAGLYLIQDPSNLRKTILPILAKTNSNPEVWEGLGTAFKIDPFGTLMSTQHLFHDLDDDTPCFAMESPGLVYGTVQLPIECFSPITYREYLVHEKDDPMGRLQGKPIKKEFYYDVAAIISKPHRSKNCSTGHKICLNKSSIAKGDEVMAIGYPLIGELSDINEVYDEQLMCAVGTITDIYETGKGNGEKWPSFLVNSNWPFGMSGGPVFNKAGHVVGVISRGMDGFDGTGVCGSAVALRYCAEKFFEKVFPCLDLSNPGWVKGWAIIREEPWEFVEIFKDKLQAREYREEQGLDLSHTIKFGSNEMGTNNFISSNCK